MHNVSDIISSYLGHTIEHSKEISLLAVEGMLRTANQQYLATYVKQEQVTPIMKACDALFGTAIQNLLLVTGGRGTSKIFKFSVKNEEFICRVTDKARPVFFVDVDSEIKNMKIADNLQLTPKIYYIDDKAGFIIMQYVPNIRLTTEILKNESNSEPLYKQLAQNLRTLHNGPNFSEKTSNIFKDVERVVKASDLNKMPPLAHKVWDTILSLEPILTKHLQGAPCHKELNGNNILFDGKKIYIIDWEASENCDLFVDLAIASNFFIFDSVKEELFLKHYFTSAPTPQQKAHLFLMKQVCLCFYAFKSLRRVTGPGKMDLSKEQADLDSFPSYKDFVLEFFNGCDKVCTTADWKTFTYVFLREVTRNIQSSQFRDAIEILSE